MGRPPCRYKIEFCPKAERFMPDGRCGKGVGRVDVSREEAEALRLKHLKKLSQTAAAKKMGISQSSFQRVLALAHERVAEAIVNGKVIRIS